MKKSLGIATLVALVLSTSVFAAPVNINKASASEIAQALNGIGESKAQAIVDYRDKNGMFEAPVDITKVKGIGASIYEKNQKDILIK